jgi:hypothetical protein
MKRLSYGWIDSHWRAGQQCCLHGSRDARTRRRRTAGTPTAGRRRRPGSNARCTGRTRLARDSRHARSRLRSEPGARGRTRQQRPPAGRTRVRAFIGTGRATPRTLRRSRLMRAVPRAEPRPSGTLAALGSVSERPALGNGPRGLQRQRFGLGVFSVRTIARPHVSLGRGRHSGHQRPTTRFSKNGSSA